MQTTFALLALAASIGSASAQGVPAGSLVPTSPHPAGCSASYSGSFEITVVTPSSKRDLSKRTTCASSGVLVASLSGGILTDSAGRIGGIVANRQFQFDGPPSQTGTIYNGGFSICSNGSLAIGGSSVFYQCLSGSFYNLYDEDAGASCMPVLIDIIPCGSSAGITQASDGQPAGPSATVKASVGPVSQISDGQPQAISATPVSQFTDGQIQVTALPGSIVPVPVSQISDGQVQATTAAVGPAPVSQISDGQVQATSAAVGPAPVPVSQISDGQVQATTAGAPVSPTAVPVSQISDGQIQATPAAPAANHTTAAAPSQFTGAANSIMHGAEVMVGAIAVAAFAVL